MHAGDDTDDRVVGLCRPAPISPARDLGAALEFYSGLGFRVSRYDDGYGYARRERLALHLRVSPELDPFTNSSAACVDTEDVQALHSEWLQRGLWVVPPVIGPDLQAEAHRRWAAGRPVGRITAVVEDKPWGVRGFAPLDPDNNQLRFGRPIL
jgi:catechol 2,3-dioxygenase-like lactoylglutathione lyase family enzyme